MQHVTTTPTGRFVKGAWIPEDPEPSSNDQAPILDETTMIRDHDEAIRMIVGVMQQQDRIMGDIASAVSHEVATQGIVLDHIENIYTRLDKPNEGNAISRGFVKAVAISVVIITLMVTVLFLVGIYMLSWFEL
jgi:hypothetical protein